MNPSDNFPKGFSKEQEVAIRNIKKKVEEAEKDLIIKNVNFLKGCFGSVGVALVCLSIIFYPHEKATPTPTQKPAYTTQSPHTTTIYPQLIIPTINK